MIRNIFSDAISKYISDDEWLYIENDYNKNEVINNETRFTLVSGRLGLRGSHFEGFIQKSLPANYMHGVFDRNNALQRELVNLPNWNLLKIYKDTEPMGPEITKYIKGYVRVLDMKNGIVIKRYINVSSKGDETLIESIHMLSRNTPESGIFRVYIKPLNYSGNLEFENIIDASITNFIDVPRFRVKHYKVKEIENLSTNGGIYVKTSTNDFGLNIVTSSKINVLYENGELLETKYVNKSYGEYAVEFFDVNVTENNTYIIEKYVSVKNGNDSNKILKESEKELSDLMSRGFEEEFKLHKEIYLNMWERADIEIKGDEKVQNALRFNIFHLMSTPDPNSNKTNIGAKLLHGEEYGGHAFWDTELFTLPFFITIFPEIAKNLVEYRYEMLDGAKRNAEKFGYLGARFPWESADTGDEECPDWTIEYDGSCYECTVAKQEIHVTSDIIYGGYNYYLHTGDEEYFEKFKEILYETSIYWLSRIEYNECKDIYELTNVTGPDEWHEDVKNNFYTNFLVKWHLELAKEVLQEKKELVNSINKVIGKIYIPNMEGVIEQFEGYFNLIDVPIIDYDINNMPLLPNKLKNIPRDRTTILKQADVIMSMFLFPNKFSEKVKNINFDYYEKRTLHRSSLSPSVYSIVGLREGKVEKGYEYFKRSLFVDYDNNQGNLKEGMHAASSGGTWQTIIYGFAGLKIENGEIKVNPQLPKELDLLKFSVVNNKKIYNIKIDKEKVEIYEKGVI